MATLTVWKFDSTGGAENALALLERMQKEELIQINDAAYVYWPEGKQEAQDGAVAQADRRRCLGGSFWGLLFGLIFFVPLLGMAVGAAMGALAGSMADVGIDDHFIGEVRRERDPRDVGAVRDDLGRRRRQGPRRVQGDRGDADLHQPVQRAGSQAARRLRRRRLGRIARRGGPEADGLRPPSSPVRTGSAAEWRRGRATIDIEEQAMTSTTTPPRQRTAKSAPTAPAPAPAAPLTARTAGRPGQGGSGGGAAVEPCGVRAGPGSPGPGGPAGAQDVTRVPELLPIRYGRMAVSAFTFFRGAALPMASDLARHPADAG